LIKPLECELCKTKFPERIKIKDEIIDLVDLQKPENDYIVLECVTKEKSEQRLIFIIHFKEKKSIKLGRHHDTDIRITDITVSRYHANLSLINGSIYIEDLNSKFGTLIQVQNDIQILPFKQISFQVGKVYLIVNMEKTLLGHACCGM
jgi:hypothetical protein